MLFHIFPKLHLYDYHLHMYCYYKGYIISSITNLLTLMSSCKMPQQISGTMILEMSLNFAINVACCKQKGSWWCCSRLPVKLLFQQGTALYYSHLGRDLIDVLVLKIIIMLYTHYLVSYANWNSIIIECVIVSWLIVITWPTHWYNPVLAWEWWLAD